MMTKANMVHILTYPVFRLGDSPLTRRLHAARLLLLKTVRVVTVVLPVATLLYLLVGFYIPASVSFTPSDSACVFSPSIAPGLLSFRPKENFTLTTPPRLSIMGKTILSSQMCVEPTAIPSGNETTLRVKQLGLPFEKKITIQNGAKLRASPVLSSDGVSTKSNMVFSLSEPDVFFDYILVASDRATQCRSQSDTIVCPTKELDLKQGELYTFSLKQTLGGYSQALFSEEFPTISSVEITSSSIEEGSIVYDTPLNLSLTTTKPIDDIGTITLSDGTSIVKIRTEKTDTGIRIAWEEQLARQKDYTLNIESLQSEDGGHLESPYTLSFSTSGGPKVTETTLSTSRTSTFPDFILRFDQDLKSGQDYTQIVSITSGGVSVPTTITSNGNELRVRTKAQIASCSEYVVSIRESLTSIHGISGGNVYTSTHRAQCAREFTIGTSVEGRSINGYALGNGAKKIVFLGAIHGNEKSTFYLLDAWINYLESNPGKIPADKTIIILPKLNPDGFLRNSRFNANDVDLNRNFGSANWKTDVIVPGGRVKAGAGGSGPLSEPESKALVEYLRQTNPILVMSYHSQGSITIPNGSGNSNALALDYANAVDYQYISAADSVTAFEHETTGALEDWLQESTDTPVVLNELSSHGATGLFQFHQAPMLKIISQ